MKIVIIGGVAAGATAAAKTRRLSPDAEITMLEAGPDISFANCGLPYYIGGDIDSRSKLILQSPKSFKDQYNVDVYTNTEVIEINRPSKTIIALDKLKNEQVEYSYDKLILAQGGKPIKPAIDGADKSHVFTLWTLDNMDAITSHIEKTEPKSAVIVGGGFIGLEMVEALAHRGLKVSVVEAQDHVMSLMDPEIAGFIEQEMKSYQVDVHTSDSVVKINDNSVGLQSGRILDADMVILSIGVRPTITLAEKASLKLGESGGLAVDEYMQTEDQDIYAAGDMVEIKHRVNDKLVRIPLAGPANKQGRIAAENALGGKHPYKGSIGTSVVRVFEAITGITGFSLKAALAAGFNADTVVVHKEHHTAYYPGAEPVTVKIVFDADTGVVLGGQTAGYKGADKRLDVLATAVAQKLTVSDLADVDFSYSPPIGTPNDAMNMAAFTAENKISNYSPSVAADQIDAFVSDKDIVYLDVRDVFAFEKSHIEDSIHIPLELLQEEINSVPKDKHILVYDETGKKGHQALRTLVQAGYENVTNISGGHSSLQRHGFAVGFENVHLPILNVEVKQLGQEKIKAEDESLEEKVESTSDTNSRLIVDVRSPGEVSSGAFPSAINIPLDTLQARYTELGEDLDREIIVYCASGARSAYAQNMLQSMGFTNVTNAGGLAQIMSQKELYLDSIKEENSNESKDENSRLIVDVRSPGEFSTGAFPDAVNIPLDTLQTRYTELGKNLDREIIVYCASGARSAYAQNMLSSMGFTDVTNAGGLAQIMSQKEKYLDSNKEEESSEGTDENSRLIVDVRSPEEFSTGAFPSALNIPVDTLQARYNELGSNLDREIIVYCASGARSAYAQNMLQSMGFTDVTNGGGLSQMMRNR